MSSTQDIELAAGASVTAAATATASSVPIVSSAFTWLAAHAGAASTAAHFGSTIALAVPGVAPVVAIGAAVYAVVRLMEESEK